MARTSKADPSPLSPEPGDRVRDDTHQEKPRATEENVHPEGQQAPIAILHHELAAVPGRVANSSSELYALGGVLGIECVGIFDEEVRVAQFVRVLSGLAVGGAAQRK